MKFKLNFVKRIGPLKTNWPNIVYAKSFIYFFQLTPRHSLDLSFKWGVKLPTPLIFFLFIYLVLEWCVRVLWELMLIFDMIIFVLLSANE